MLHQSPTLIHVVPQLKPGRCGVTDHVLPLAAELKGAFGVGSGFVVLNSDARCDLPYPVVHCEQAELLDSCLKVTEDRKGAMLVHVSGYGYSADGVPAQLADAMARVRRDGRFRMAAYVHEVSASGMPWTTAFWNSRRQKDAVRRIAKSCDLVVTNISAHAEQLASEKKREAAAPVQVLPVFSTVGEALARNPMGGRRRDMVVFGLPARRRRAYEELHSLSGLMTSLGITEIVDIGTGSEAPETVHGIGVKRRGELDPSEVAREVSRAMFGFISYPANCLGKSSIFAAYCAHGTVPVIARPFSGVIDGLRDGVHLLSPETARKALESGLDACSLAAWQWYSGHRVHVHAETYASWLEQPAQEIVSVEAGR